jgi:c-di-GMP-binding flagellar brake protein YcgR
MRRMEAWLTRLDTRGVKRHSVRVVNLSGGGAMIVVPPHITVGDRVYLELPRRFGIGPLKLHGEVVWTEEEKSTCRAGIRFTISERVRDQVIRMVFAQELRSAA